MKINGKAVKAGTYALFTIPGKKEWTVIINGVSNQWGAYKYDQEQDIMRFTVSPKKMKELTERMTFDITPEGDVSLTWEHLQIAFKIEEQ